MCYQKPPDPSPTPGWRCLPLGPHGTSCSELGPLASDLGEFARGRTWVWLTLWNDRSAQHHRAVNIFSGGGSPCAQGSLVTLNNVLGSKSQGLAKLFWPYSPEELSP